MHKFCSKFKLFFSISLLNIAKEIKMFVVLLQYTRNNTTADLHIFVLQDADETWCDLLAVLSGL